RPVLETLREDTGLWALGDDADAAAATPTATTRELQVKGTETLTEPTNRRLARTVVLAAVAIAAGGVFAWRSQSSDDRTAAPPSPAIAAPVQTLPAPTVPTAIAPIDASPIDVATPMAIDAPTAPPPAPPRKQHKRETKASPPPAESPTLIVRPPLKDPDT